MAIPEWEQPKEEEEEDVALTCLTFEMWCESNFALLCRFAYAGSSLYQIRQTTISFKQASISQTNQYIMNLFFC